MADLHAEVERLSALIDKGIAALTEAAKREAAAEWNYRRNRAQAWAEHTAGTAKEREDQVNAVTADDRYRRDLAAGERQAALEALRSRRQQLSAIQTLSNADRAEAEFARTGPGRVA